MALSPIEGLGIVSKIKPIRGSSPGETQVQTGVDQNFKALFNSIIDNVEETEAITKEDSYKLSIGEMDDLHTMMINSARADIALQTMVQLRNKVLDAYTEIMRINL
jgi:flagellar hook-basal body complex protein FliE